jgi:serine/threonine protein phosphatase PrpC
MTRMNAAKQLLGQANDAGGRDNITLLIARFDPVEAGAGNPADAR